MIRPVPPTAGPMQIAAPPRSLTRELAFSGNWHVTRSKTFNFAVTGQSPRPPSIR